MSEKMPSILMYHQQTSHSRGALSGRTMIREEYPIPFKHYRGVESRRFERGRSPRVALSDAFGRRSAPTRGKMAEAVASICHLAAGISLVRQQVNGMSFHFRTVASAGALYPAELYVAVQSVKGMDDGLYHYCPHDESFTCLRSGYIFGALSGGAPIVRFYVSSIYHRSSWKYGARAYRYCLLDAGHMAENVMLASRIHGFPAQLDYDFNDKAMTRLLGIDPAFEGGLLQVHALNCKAETEVDETVPLTAEGLDAFSRTAPKALAPEMLLQVHTATSSFARCPVHCPSLALDNATELPEPEVQMPTVKALTERRSKRNFVNRQARLNDVHDIIAMVCRDKPPVCSDAVQVGFIASEGSGLQPGYYRLNRAEKTYSLVNAGQYGKQAAHVCLDQSWLENAALQFVFTADLESLNRQCGPRAYRYAHLEAGRLGQRLYLAATAKNYGACGIGAFFDNEAAQLLSLPTGHSMLYLVAVGPIKN